VELVARYGTAFEKLTFDLSFGNVITPGPVRLEFPSLLGQSYPLLAYPLETIVAEKSAAIVEIGLTNTRLKDFYDLYYIAQHESLQADVLRQACKRTFAARGTPPERLELFETLGSDARLATAWQNFLNRTGLSAPNYFAEVITEIQKLLEPVIKG
jgi:predicted nucleotidyltransferase component of viral defense system